MTKELKNKLKHVYKEVKYKKLIGCNNLYELVGNLCDYDLLIDYDETKLLGYCDVDKKKIMIAPTGEFEIQIKATLLHELGHAYQQITGHFESVDWLLSSKIKEEQEAEKIGFYLFKIIYPEISNPEKYFQIPYQTQRSIDLLKQYYKGWVIDDLYSPSINLT